MENLPPQKKDVHISSPKTFNKQIMIIIRMGRGKSHSSCLESQAGLDQPNMVYQAGPPQSLRTPGDPFLHGQVRKASSWEKDW